MKVRFYLRDPNSGTTTAIYARIFYSGRKLKYYISDSIHPKFWNKKGQRAQQSKQFPEYPEFNQRLDDIDAEIKTTIRRLTHSNKALPTPEQVKNSLDTGFFNKAEVTAITVSLLSYYQDFIKHSETGIRLHPKTGKPITEGTIKTYRNARIALIEFEKTTGYRVDFDTITMEFYKKFLAYCYEKNYMANYIGKLIAKLKTVMQESYEDGIHKNLEFQKRGFAYISEDADNIALTETERDYYSNVDLSEDPILDNIRDRFIIGCYSGLRYSDYSILDAEKIANGYITIKQTKTGNPVVIPIHEKVKAIILKHGGKLPPAVDHQTTNELLKTIGAKCESLKALETVKYTQGGKPVTERIARYDMITTHTARRTFATLEYLAGTPTITIMAITSHKTEKDFLKYLKISSNEHAQKLTSIWNERNNKS